MFAYELLAHLTYLTLAGKGEDGYEWIGNRNDWNLVENEIEAFERMGI